MNKTLAKKTTRPTVGGRWYSLEEIIEKQEKHSPSFRKAHEEEVARLHLAYRLRTLRESKKLTQAAVAELAGMPQSVIARLESGNHSVSVDTLRRVATVFGKTVQIV